MRTLAGSCRAAALALALMVCSLEARADGPPFRVDVQLVLAVDISFSISTAEQDIQKRGYVAAFRDAEVIRAMISGYRGRVAVTVLEWAGDDLQAQVVPWTLIATPRDAHAFADRLAAAPIHRSGRTSISAALSTALALMQSGPFLGDRQVVDISSDGLNNSGARVDRARDALVYRGITINGLPIVIGEPEGPEAALATYFQDCVIGGAGAFVAPVPSWDAFAPTLRRKLIAELSGPAFPAPQARILRAAAPMDCLAGEKEERRKYIKQLRDATGDRAPRWLPREEDWPMPD